MKLVCVCIVYLVSVHSAVSQKASDASKIQPKIKASEVIYREAMENDPHLYNGVEYIEFTKNTEGTPYYPSDTPISGTLTYSSVKYKNVPLQYDILVDKLITEHPSLSGNVQLIDDNIREFTLGKKTFFRIADSTKVNIPNGFYEQLYAGESQCLAKRRKTIIKLVQNGELLLTFDLTSKYYILKNEKYVHVTNKRSLYQVLIDQRPLLRQFVKKSRLNFRRDPADMLAKVAAYYDELKTK